MIDVIIPAYNCTATLKQTLSSLVAQTDPNFKVTIVDDCSTQDITSIINKYVDDLNITYIRNEKNLGCGMSRQVGIDNSTESHFCFLDSDDVFMPYTVETFNSIIKANPNIEYIHSYFYEQTIIDGNPALILMKDGFTWCHGKLYNRSLINKFGIKNSPLVKWADDSYFNSMCTELMETQVIKIPLYLWCNNINSIVRRTDPDRDKAVRKDFLNAMKMSTEFVLQYKNEIEHMNTTINRIKSKGSLNADEQQLLDVLLKYTKE
jgi:glycosyltransferase involved in cell wall biosynthesis